MESDSHYSFLLGLLFQRMSAPFYEMALDMVEKFVPGNILPGVVDDIGTLSYAAVTSNPDVGLELLLKSIIKNLHLSLLKVSGTKYGGNIVPIKCINDLGYITAKNNYIPFKSSCKSSLWRRCTCS